MLETRSLTISAGGKRILDRVSMRVERGETVALFGPNGSGKTTLLRAIMGLGDYRLESGSIHFNGKDITTATLDERARMGIGLLFQRPPAVRGVKLGEMLRIAGRVPASDADTLKEPAERLGLADALARDVNLGFSGGEIKRSELLQLLLQRPAFMMFDEPDSGVDLVNIGLVGAVISELLEKETRATQRMRAGLIISHTGHILDYVSADRAYVMIRGTLTCSGNPRDLINDIRTRGYEGCVTCASPC